MIKTINFNGKHYPFFQSEGFASKFCFPFAKEVCTGVGYDIGCNKKEWSFPNSIPIDLNFNDGFDANNLPHKNVDYIFSSHCLEHIPNWVQTMDYWYETLKDGGVLFLYLPDYSQEYWRPWNNRKHLHVFTPQIIKDYLIQRQYKNIFVTGPDLHNSFITICEK
jgi:hypothetical protein